MGSVGSPRWEAEAMGAFHRGHAWAAERGTTHATTHAASHLSPTHVKVESSPPRSRVRFLCLLCSRPRLLGLLPRPSHAFEPSSSSGPLEVREEGER